MRLLLSHLSQSLDKTKNMKLLRLAALCISTSLAALQAAEPLHLHIISGSNEYKSEASLKPFAEKLAEDYGVQVTASWVKDGAKTLRDYEEIEKADVLLVFARRLKLPDDQMAPIRTHWEAGKGIVGIRTSSHAFSEEDNKIFDQQVMGGNYKGHFGDEAVTVRITEAAGKHPVMTDVGEIASKKLYKADELGKGTTLLQEGTIESKDGKKSTQPVTWTNQWKNGHTFYTSLGVPSDFEDPDFVRMLTNAIFWTGGRPLSTTP